MKNSIPLHFQLPFSEKDVLFICDDLLQILLSFNFNSGEIFYKYFATQFEYNKTEELTEFSPLFWDWIGEEFLKKSMENKHVEIAIRNNLYRMLPLRRDQNKDIFE